MIRIIIGVVLLVIFFLGLLGSIFGKEGNVPSYLLFASIILLIPGVLFIYFGLRSIKLRTEPKLTTNLKEDIPNRIKVIANNAIKNDNSESKLQDNLQPPFKSKKFTQKPEGIIVLLILFFPVGIYFMWKEKMWSSKARIIITSVISLLIIIAIAGQKDSISTSVNEDRGELLPKVFYGTYYGDNTEDGRFTINSDNTFNWYFSTGFSKGTYEIIRSEGDNPSNWYCGIKIKVLEGETIPDDWEFYMNYANVDMRRVLTTNSGPGSYPAYWHMN